MVVTATEFKTNFGKYLAMVQDEVIYVTKNGKFIAKISNPNVSSVDALRGLLSDLPDDTDSHTVREERLRRYEIDD